MFMHLTFPFYTVRSLKAKALLPMVPGIERAPRSPMTTTREISEAFTMEVSLDLTDEEEFAKKEGKRLSSYLRRETGYFYPFGISVELLTILGSLSPFVSDFCGFCHEEEGKTHMS